MRYIFVAVAAIIILTAVWFALKGGLNMGGTSVSNAVIEMVRSDKDIILVDVRTPEEYREKRIPGSILLPDYEIRRRAAEVIPDRNARIVVYCRSGRRSAEAAKVLKDMGYQNVYDLGGIIDWPYETISGE